MVGPQSLRDFDPPSPSESSAGQQPSFEEALQRLQTIVQELDQGELGLDRALERYEEGIRLLRQCHEVLQKAERRIELLSGVDAEGRPICTPLAEAGRPDPCDPA